MKIHTILLTLIFFLAFAIRFIGLTNNPPGLYIDEVSIGYNAYTILTKGVDEHGEKYPMAFRAFGEYKMPLYIYMTVASIALFGKNELAVRMPAFFTGFFTVVFFYLLLKELLEVDKEFLYDKLKKPFLLLSTLLLTLSPWHVMFSRTGFEATAGLFFYIISCYFFLRYLQVNIKNTDLSFRALRSKVWLRQMESRNLIQKNFKSKFTLIFNFSGMISLHSLVTSLPNAVTSFGRGDKKKLLLITSFLSLAATVYSYNSYKVISPITLVFFILILWKKIRISSFLVATCIGAVLIMAPILLFTLSPNGSTRFAQTSAFADYAKSPVLIKAAVYPLIYLKNYTSFLSPTYLFSWGDGFDRQRVPGFGNQARWQLFFFAFAVFWAIRRRKDFGWTFMLFLLFVSPLAGALTLPSPHAVRSLLLVIPFVALVAYACVALFASPKKWAKALLGIAAIIVLYETGLFYHYYFVLYPRETIIAWGGGYKNTVQEATALQNTYNLIVLNEIVGNDYAFFKFYNDKLQYTETSKYVNWTRPSTKTYPKILYITSDPKDSKLQNIPHKLIKNIYVPNSSDIFVQFYEI